MLCINLCIKLHVLLETPHKISTLEKRWGQVQPSFCVEEGHREAPPSLGAQECGQSQVSRSHEENGLVKQAGQEDPTVMKLTQLASTVGS